MSILPLTLRLLMGVSVIAALAVGLYAAQESGPTEGLGGGDVVEGESQPTGNRASDELAASEINVANTPRPAPSSSAPPAPSGALEDSGDGSSSTTLITESTSTTDPTTTTTELVTTTTQLSTTTTKPPTTTTTPSTTSTTTPPSESGPLVINGQSGTVIQGVKVSNPSGPCIRIANSSNIVVRDSELGPCGGRAVEIENASGVTLERLIIKNSSTGVYALTSSGIVVTESRFEHAGRNFVQFDKVSGSGNAITSNSGWNQLGGSNAEDFISLFRSSGTASSPIRVTGNHFSNGGPSGSGSGILVGDYGGEHILVQGNVLMNPGQVGIGVAGGSSIRIIGNTVFSNSQPWSNVGIYVWNQSAPSCHSIEVRGNQVEWYSSSGSLNGGWNAGNCGTVAGWDDNNWAADIG